MTLFILAGCREITKNDRMLNQAEGSFKGAGGPNLFFQTWTPPTVKGHLVITHGQGEHSDCYHRVIDHIADLGLKIWAWDLRGHGKSQGPRGSIRDFSYYAQDLEILIKRLVFPAAKKAPLILMGHSMGALVQLQTVLDDQDLRDLPQVISSPFLGVAVKVPAWKATLSSVAYQVLPQISLDSGLTLEMLTRDPEIISEYKRDPLRHFKISSGAFEGAKMSMEQVIEEAELFTGPLMLMGPEDDPVVSTPKFKEFHRNLKSPKVKFKLYPDRRHEIFNDLDREQPLQDLKIFLSEQL